MTSPERAAHSEAPLRFALSGLRSHGAGDLGRRSRGSLCPRLICRCPCGAESQHSALMPTKSPDSPSPVVRRSQAEHRLPARNGVRRSLGSSNVRMAGDFASPPDSENPATLSHFEPLVGLGLGNTVGFSAECRKAGRLVRRCLKRNRNVVSRTRMAPGVSHRN